MRRVLAIARTDVRVRLSRGSSVALLVALCIFAYVIVPDVSTGRSLMQVNGHRALYNSATIALATSSLCALLLGMLGFYLISNTIRRDLATRTGFVIASTPVRNAEYLSGKLLGSIAFLSLIVVVYILNVMGMQLLRGEAGIEPLTYAGIFLAAVGPAIVVVAGFALAFECVRPLSGRFGDIVYFFVWVALLSVPAANAIGVGGGAAAYFDVFGLAFLIKVPHGQALTDFPGRNPEISIGANRFDPALAPWHFHGVPWTAHLVETRVTTAALVFPLFFIAWLAFARFDPARVKRAAGSARASIFGRISAPFAPLVRAARPASWAGPGLLRMALGEIALSVMLHPVVMIAAIAAAIAGVVVSAAGMRSALLPAVFLAMIACLADIPTRDRSAGVDGMRGGIPRVARLAVPARLLGAIGLAVAFVIVPLLRLAVMSGDDAISLFVGATFFASAAVALGTVARTPKLFAGIALLFFYVVMSSPRAAEVDFAGWNGAATNAVRVAYLAAAIALAGTALLTEWYRARREGT